MRVLYILEFADTA